MIRNVEGMYKSRTEKERNFFEICIALLFMQNRKFSRKVIRKKFTLSIGYFKRIANKICRFHPITYSFTYPRYKHGISKSYISNMKIVYLRIVNFEIVY